MMLRIRSLLEPVMHEEVLNSLESFFPQCFSFEDQSAESVDQRVRALHATDILLLHLESDHSKEVNLLTLDCRKGVPLAEQSQDLLLLFLPSEL